MISKITGIISAVSENRVTVDVDGVGYEVHIPTALCSVVASKKGEEFTFHTYHYLQGGPGASSAIPILIGFEREVDREFFERFITVAGIGPKAAVRSFAVPTSRIAAAIENEDMAGLIALPGIGRQRATEIVAKLKGKVYKFALLRDEEHPAVERTLGDVEAEVLEVLLQLGYRRGEAEEMIRKVAAKMPTLDSTEEFLQEIYRNH